MAQIQHINVDDLVLKFEESEDPRCTAELQHPLGSVIVIALMAMLGGAIELPAIHRWVVLHENFLLNALTLPNGIPGKSVCRRLLMALRPSALERCFVNQLKVLRASAAVVSGVEQARVSAYGTMEQQSTGNHYGAGALRPVSVWASEFGLSLRPVARGEGEKQHRVIPALLKLVDLKGAVIAVSETGRPQAISARIVESEADYVMVLKPNADTLHQAVIKYVDEQLEGQSLQACEHPKARMRGCQEMRIYEQGHRLLNVRTYLQVPAPKSLPGCSLWKGLRSIGVVTSCCVRDGTQTIEGRYYLSSLAVGVKRFARTVRGHWGIEDNSQWTLDVTYRHDEPGIREQTLRDNVARLNRFALKLLEQHPDHASLAIKRRLCCWNTKFLLEVLTRTGR